MPIRDGYTDLPPGKLVNVATCLEMFVPPAQRPEPPGATGRLIRIETPDVDGYRRLFRRIGEPFLWFSRLALTDEELAAVIGDPRVEVYTLGQNDAEVGFLELDFRIEGECEIVFFGLVESAIGTGMGRLLMNRAIERAWSRPIRRLWVHTCTLDHPSALPFYVRSGFHPFKRQIELYDDPRLVGLLSKTAAPNVPLL